MKQSKGKLLTWIIIFTLVLVALTGCGADSAKTDSKGDSGKKVELRFSWWGGEDRHAATIEAIEKYMELNPNVVIKPEYSGFDGYNQKLSTQLAGGTAPDIMQMDYYYMAEFAKKGEHFIDLYEYDDSLAISEFDEKFLNDFAVVDDKLVGIPTGVNSILFFADKNMLNEYDISLGEKYDWDQLIEEGKKVNQANSDKYFLHMGPRELGSFAAIYMQQQTGENFIKDDYTLSFDKKMLVEAFTYIKRLWDEGVVSDISDYATVKSKINQAPKWINGDLATVLMSASTIDIFKTSHNDLTPVLLPIRENAVDTGIKTQPSQVFSVSKKSKHAEEAVKFLNWFLTDEEAIKILGSSRGAQPTEKGRQILADSGEMDPLIAEGVDLGLKNSGIPVNSISIDTEVSNVFYDCIEKLGYGELTPEKAADHLIKQLDKVLEDLKPE